ncbi:MAG: hypothetical protein P0Y49_09430 [Candidatus Pedobacter colombiensis]|uniref:TerB family tellurite resistance protein n=1 Tax=Candidatus Pedobacter colombiensis TaxID=3121371 RepID=A0AAJ6B9D4_9SPHI|nr:hypothetical protein [Pedobacter sp.]WEK21361.1 MAG: hypothetical protein P0Y49_09430 [Pedobacter sp.]
MKNTIKIFLLLILFSTAKAKAQTWEELFDQSRTQTKYLIEQVAALQVYITHVQKTYKIAKEGLNFIGDAAKGEFNLHDEFFTSLQNVNPTVRKYPQIASIIVLQSRIISSTKNYNKTIRDRKTLGPNEMDYVITVFDRVLKDCAAILDELIAVTSSNKLEMKDDERIARIDKLYNEMQQNYAFTENFGSGAVQLAVARADAKTAIENSRILNNIKK